MGKPTGRIKYLTQVMSNSAAGRAHPLAAVYLMVDFFARKFCNRCLNLRTNAEKNWGNENIMKIIAQHGSEYINCCGYSDWNLLRKYILNDCKREKFYDFGGIKFPLSNLIAEDSLENVFDEVIVPYLLFGNRFYESFHKKTHRVHYGLERDDFKVCVEKGDVVVDAGSWIGDFSAYASNCGAVAYGFEPSPVSYGLLCETAELNPNIIPVNSGLGERKERLPMFTSEGENQSSTGNTFIRHETITPSFEIDVTTLDDFVRENDIRKIDFIKADIEGFERNMLEGAKNVLSNFVPKLAICTYHLFDDPEVLEDIIKKANPNYRIVQMPKILFALAPERK